MRITRRDWAHLSMALAALAGLLLLLATLGWLLWRESAVVEERRLGDLARRMGEQTERALIDVRDLLSTLDALDVPPCSPDHLRRLDQAVVSRPYVRAIRYWQAVNIRCGTGLLHSEGMTPPDASRIYDSGVIAWWPGPHTRVGDVELFMMRFGRHDVVIDPRLLMTPGLLDGQSVGLWVEDLPMARYPADAALPDPAGVRPGLSIDTGSDRILSRFSLGAIFPIEIVAVQPVGQFWQRYLPKLIGIGGLGLVLALLWLTAVVRYSRHRLGLAEELRQAIADDLLAVVYQPIVELPGGRCVGAEALVRWPREDGDTISPDVFVPLAEQTGQGEALTRAVLRRTLRDLSDLLRGNDGFTVSINLTGQELAGPEFAETLKAMLADACVPSTAIRLELTERSLLDADATRQSIAELRRRGHRIAIDDFGTGYSSLSYLQSFELDTLKIDKAFVDGIESQDHVSGVIAHVIDIARALQLDLVAEGIESQHQVDWLVAQGVGHGQGYHFSRGVPAADFRQWLAQQPTQAHR